MAFWKRRNKAVYVYSWKDGRQCVLPRSATKHLDSEPDHNIDTWVGNWALANEAQRPPGTTLTNTETLRLVEDFCAYLEKRGKSPKTVVGHRHNLTAHVLPFFVELEGLTQPSQWVFRSVRLYTHLSDTKALSPRLVNLCNISLRRFWEWLVEEQIAEGALKLRNAIEGVKKTPLKKAVVPDDVLKAHFKRDDIRLLALIGYFFSLRPQEVIALRPMDFRAGSQAAALEACKTMTKAGLYGKFAVHIHRQVSGKRMVAPKAGSEGMVACFSEAAAKEIVAALKDRKKDERLFPSRMDQWFKLWRRMGLKGVTMKDLRRASLYWLGHYGVLDFTALKNHARHSDPATTALYVRRPEEDPGEFDELDLDA
jgi:integrase